MYKPYKQEVVIPAQTPPPPFLQKPVRTIQKNIEPELRSRVVSAGWWMASLTFSPLDDTGQCTSESQPGIKLNKKGHLVVPEQRGALPGLQMPFSALPFLAS